MMRYKDRTPTERVAIFLMAFVLVFGITVVIVSASKANVSESRGICRPGHSSECLSPARAASKFRHGHFHRSHGLKPAAVFKNPKAFRKLAHRKMVVFLHHHPKVEGQLRHKYLTKRDPGCSDRCLAWKTYGDLMAHSNCDATGPPTMSPYTCAYPQTGHRKAAIRIVTVAYCGGALVLGAVGAFSSDGAAAPAVATIYGGIGCGWGFMSSFFG